MNQKVKMVKYSDDRCFGKEFNKEQQCSCCWIHRACQSAYKSMMRAKAK